MPTRPTVYILLYTEWSFDAVFVACVRFQSSQVILFSNNLTSYFFNATEHYGL